MRIPFRAGARRLLSEIKNSIKDRQVRKRGAKKLIVTLDGGAYNLFYGEEHADPGNADREPKIFSVYRISRQIGSAPNLKWREVWGKIEGKAKAMGYDAIRVYPTITMSRVLGRLGYDAQFYNSANHHMHKKLK